MDPDKRWSELSAGVLQDALNDRVPMAAVFGWRTDWARSATAKPMLARGGCT